MNGDMSILLRQICRRWGRKGVLGVPYNQVLLKEINVDSTLKNHEIYRYLQHQSLTLFGKPADQWFLDMAPCLYAATIAERHCFRVAAAPRESILAWLHICRKSRLRIKAVDIDILALTRLMPTFENYRADQPQALIWSKLSELIFIVARGGDLIYIKRTAYSPTSPLSGILTSLLQFYNGLYPQQAPIKIFLIDENNSVATANLGLTEPAVLNREIWQTSSTVTAAEFCSLGLAIYDH